MVRATSRILFAGILTFSTVTLSQAQVAAKPAPVRMELPDNLVKRAKVTEAAARKTALASVMRGTVTAVELEEEDGEFVYSYDLKVAGKEGVTEVWVDAMTGTIVKTELEDDPKGEDEEDDDGKPEAREGKAAPAVAPRPALKP